MAKKPRVSDAIIRMLADVKGPLGELASAFPGDEGVTGTPGWIDEWFIAQSNAFAANRPPKKWTYKAEPDEAADLSPLRRAPASKRVRLVELRISYFRGFRAASDSIDFDGDLIVVEGANSSGKTSLAEALEWLFSGQLSRRSSGHARELAGCITNEFRPTEEQTWVEAVLLVDGERQVIRRILVQDYSEHSTDEASSRLSLNDAVLTPEREKGLLNELFAGVAPILMQHTLGLFIHESPSNRRKYFERLLQMDELTALIANAVVGAPKASSFAPSTGAVAHTKWIDLKGLSPEAKRLADKFEKQEQSRSLKGIQELLVKVASPLFPETKEETKDFPDTESTLQQAQREQRERRFPILAGLRLPNVGALTNIAEPLVRARKAWTEASARLESATQAAGVITQSDLAVAHALDALVSAGLLQVDSSDAITCPLCAYDDAPTLTPARLRHLRANLPVAQAVDEARRLASTAEHALISALHDAKQQLNAVHLKPVADDELRTQIAALDPAVGVTVAGLNTSARSLISQVETMQREIDRLAQPTATSTAWEQDLERAIDTCTEISQLTERFAQHYASVEQSLGVVAHDDVTYARRERWLAVAADMDGVLAAVNWEHAKSKALVLLKDIRDGLIELRAAIIEDARHEFSDRMTSVWATLRKDTASGFSRLVIPDAKGKGQKLEIEIKATVSDKENTHEVDALKIFSESQMNVLGIAAYITRAKLLGHSVLVFDDPVQSMDDEHFRSFAGPLLSSLVDEGFQVIVLSHSDEFQRDIADAHVNRLSYATLRSRSGRRYGVRIEEGSRRVAERLKSADTLADDGQIENAWIMVRLALERLYLLTYAKSNPGFDTRSWRKQTGESMFKAGAGKSLEAAFPGCSAQLRDILTLTGPGAHDGPTRGVTDLKLATAYIRSLLGPLGLGDG